jgi:GPH family glycoside/pentoside/hexuronide:cation symporter
MATDAIDDIEVSTGSRDDGTAYSVFNFFRKLGQVLAAICVNGALLGMHYRYEKGAVQTLDNLKKMYDLATLIPAVMFALMALILFVWYPLSRSRVEELQVLKEKRLKESYEKKIIDI